MSAHPYQEYVAAAQQLLVTLTVRRSRLASHADVFASLKACILQDAMPNLKLPMPMLRCLPSLVVCAMSLSMAGPSEREAVVRLQFATPHGWLLHAVSLMGGSHDWNAALPGQML